MLAGLRTTVAADVAFGEQGEIKILPKLKRHFNDASITKTSAKYCPLDFTSECGTIYELKSRRIRKNAYPTTLLPLHKVRSDDQYFLFSFLDGDCYIKYDPELFKTFATQVLLDCRQGTPKEQDHFLIPIGLLTDF